MKCEICGKRAIQDMIALYRMNKPGEMPARWRCEGCIPAESKDEIMRGLGQSKGIIEAIEQSNKERKIWE